MHMLAPGVIPESGTSPTRIAVIAPSLDILGGQGIQASALMDALTDAGFNICFIPLNPRFPGGLGWVRRVPWLRTLLNQLLYRWQLRQLRHIDRVHLFSASYWSFVLSQVPAIKAARRYGKPVTLNYHSGEADDHLRNWGRLVHPWLEQVDSIVVPSPYLQKVFGRHGYKTRVIPNMIRLEQFNFRQRKPLHPNLLSIRNLESIYCVENTIRAFSLLKKQLPTATLTIAGYGSQESALRQLATDQEIEGIRFIGRVEPGDVAATYDACDIFINSSLVDNQPVSILESFAAGLPVISTPTGDIKNMIDPGINGILVPHNEPQAIADAVLWLINNPADATTMAISARNTVENYTWGKTSRAWIELCSGIKT